MPKLLFAIATPFYPQSSGGAEHSTLTLLNRLRQKGWEIEVACQLQPSREALEFLVPDRRRARRLPKKPALFAACDNSLGYRCWRLNGSTVQIQRWLGERLRRFRPDVALGHSPEAIPLLKQASGNGCAGFYFLRDSIRLRENSKLSDGIQPIANSPFIAGEAFRITRKSIPVILPFVDPERYRVRRRRRLYITFINPIPEKGVRVALEAARRLPQSRFLIVRGKWWMRESKPFRLPKGSLPNVETWEHQQDMRRVYAVTDILLVPSQCPESFCRIIVEAHLNGIPVVASAVAGIPFTLGEGGILVTPKGNVSGYVKALERLRSDKKLYRRLSALALKNSRRPEFQPGRQVNRFLSLVEPRLR